MALLIAGLTLFLGAHSIRIGADEWRSRQIARFGATTWKIGHSAVSLIGLGLIILGFGQTRQAPVLLWPPPVGMPHLTALLVLLAFVLIAAAYVPRNHIKARLHHPMLLGVQAWALGHLLANGELAGVILFASFLIWALLDLRAARRRDRDQETRYAAGTLPGTMISLVVGVLIWLGFLVKLHGALIGVPVLG
ncbi:MAG: NnrU family protein [Castellaniella sp.]|uniref:NnrU family protein n=1 Tax=Castellaniella sp. TaxID=1955812 RepID=UPI003C782126